MGQRSNCAAVTDAKIMLKIGGVCVRHGAKLKRCSSEGCSNQVKKGGVCRRHGAYRNTHDKLLHLDPNSNRLLQLYPNPSSLLLGSPSEDKDEEAFPKR
mmetsp:Transcript_19939/g.39956  ORF Transcript_19939/g.39956 Transcript_19939/m.39956 type:complete len:99 (+) Transcript_19939:278-574(+)